MPDRVLPPVPTGGHGSRLINERGAWRNGGDLSAPWRLGSGAAGYLGGIPSRGGGWGRVRRVDVRRTLDGRLVSFHAARAPQAPWAGVVPGLSYGRLCELAGYRVPLAAEIMELLAGRALGHLDLKGAADGTAIIDQALGLLGPSGFVVTTGADRWQPLPSAASRRWRLPSPSAATWHRRCSSTSSGCGRPG